MIIPLRTPKLLKRLMPSCVWDIPTEKNEIYLTFDDGPIPCETEFVLDELDRVGAKATFFWVGDNVRKHPQVARKVVERGHSVGNHTFHHVVGWGMSVEKYLEEVRLCDEIIRDVTGLETRLFRPPHGRISRGQLKVLKTMKTVVMWDVLTVDYDARLSRKLCLSRSSRLTRPGSLVVFHDSVKAKKNLRGVLPEFLDYFALQDFGFQLLDM
ncbi:polysaccharide deacetylase family protein [Fulvitalea axinellae]